MGRLIVVTKGNNLGSNYFGDGSDGDFRVSASTMLPATVDTGHIFKQYRTLTIDAGAVLQPANRCAGMVISVRGDCTVNGTLSMDLKAPLRSDETEAIILNSGASSKWLQKISTLTGGPGGDGGANDANNRGKGGLGHRFGGGFGGGGAGRDSHQNRYAKGGDSEPRPPVGITWPYPGTTGAGSYGTGGGASYGALGGRAPGGGGGYFYVDPDTNLNGGAGNAYGGGLILLVVGGSLTIGPSGLITANGGNGGAAGHIGSYAGGGGGGGIIALLANNPITLLGNLTANGGKTGAVGTPGVDGSVGTIYTAHMDNFGVVTPWAA